MNEIPDYLSDVEHWEASQEYLWENMMFLRRCKKRGMTIRFEQPYSDQFPEHSPAWRITVCTANFPGGPSAETVFKFAQREFWEVAEETARKLLAETYVSERSEIHDQIGYDS